MSKSNFIVTVIITAFLFVFAGCNGTDESQSGPAPADGPIVSLTGGNLDRWLAQIRNGEIATDNIATSENGTGSLAWGMGYLTYYGSIESVGLDNLLYNALRVHRQLDTGEVSRGNLTGNLQLPGLGGSSLAGRRGRSVLERYSHRNVGRSNKHE